MASQRVLVLALAVCVLWGVVATVASIYYYQQTMTIRSSLVIVSVSIDYGNGTTRVYPEVYLSKEATVLDAARNVAKVSTKQYSWGTIVTAINDVPNSSDKFWQFWVNGEYGMTAADMAVLRSGDRLEWKLAKSMFS
jgi:hypothetical protein